MLRVGVDYVYKVTDSIKKTAKKIESHLESKAVPISNELQVLESLNSISEKVISRKRDAKLSRKDRKSNNPALLKEIQSFFNENGIYQFTSNELRIHLLSKLPESQVPSAKVIREIIQDKFKLKFSRLDKANTQYRNAKYNEKRLWTSRLLAQLIFE
jgi:hypothetical protein